MRHDEPPLPDDGDHRLIAYFMQLRDAVPLDGYRISFIGDPDAPMVCVDTEMAANSGDEAPSLHPGAVVLRFRTIVGEDESGPERARNQRALAEFLPTGVMSSETLDQMKASDPPPSIGNTTAMSFVEMITLLPERGVPKDRLTAAMDLCIRRLVEVSRACHGTLSDTRVSALTFERLPFVAWYSTRRAVPSHDWDGDGLGALLLPTLASKEGLPPRLSKDQSIWLQANLASLAQSNPVLVSVEHFAKAHTARNIGDRGQAVTHVAIAAETLFDALLALILFEEHQIDPESAVGPLGGWLTARVKAQFHPRLGGSWALTGDGPLAKWDRHIATLRNRVIHRGYTPTQRETHDAFLSFNELHEFLIKRLVEKRNDFRRAALLLVGTKRLREEGHYRGPFREAVEQKGEREATWLSDFNAWRDRVDELIVAADARRS